MAPGLSAFWDQTTWRDAYYRNLTEAPLERLTAAERAEREHWSLEKATVDRLVARAVCTADLGCGTGRVTAALAERYLARQFIGVDISPAQLDVYARRLSKSAKSRVRLLCAPMSEVLLAPQSVDLALLCNHTLGSILGDDRRASLAAIRGWLSADGRVLVSGFSALDLAPECYANWGMSVEDIDPVSGMVRLARHRCLWESSSVFTRTMATAGFVLLEGFQVGLGYVHTYAVERGS